MTPDNFIDKLIIKAISSYKDGLSKLDIIDFVDYYDKIGYAEDEMMGILKRLENEGKIKSINKKWVINSDL